MLLAVVHANGSYYPSENGGEGLNVPPLEMPDGFHDRLARLVLRHLDNAQPVAYLPYWIDPENTGIHHDSDLQARALGQDPFFQALQREHRSGIAVIPDGPDPRLDRHAARARDRQLDVLATGQKTACFVGAYAGACVLDRAVKMHDRMSPIERPKIFIDPDYCVDISSRPVTTWASGWIELARYSRYSE